VVYAADIREGAGDMVRTAKALAARLREGYEANNWGPALEVLSELEAAGAASVVGGAGSSDLSGGSAPAVEAESCGDPVLGKAAVAEAGEHEEPEDEPAPEDEDDPFGGDASGYPDRAHEDGEESPGLHHRSRTPRRPARRRK